MSSLIQRLSTSWLYAAGIVVALLVLWATSAWWLHPLVEAVNSSPDVTESAGDGHDAGHDAHAADDHGETDSIELSPQARKNIGLETGSVTLGEYTRSITVPAMVTERPGETSYKIAAPLTGIVTAVSVVKGEAVRSDDLLFTLRLTHEDLVKAQTEFLRLLEELDVERKELARLEKITAGGVAGKLVLERQYEIDKLQAQLKAQRAALQLHGLSRPQVAEIAEDRDLLRMIQVRAPLLHADESIHHEAEDEHDVGSARSAASGMLAAGNQQTGESSVAVLDPEPHVVHERQFVVQTLNVQTGEAVQAGQTLCVLVDYERLYVEGRAFEQDADEVIAAVVENRPVTAITETGTNRPQAIEGLKVVYVSNEIERDSRALPFYVGLPNEIVRDATDDGGRHFLTWKHKPGQRMQLRVPVETWQNVITLPVDAIAEEGPETFVFVENGDRFERRPVHVVFRDPQQAVLENDGSVFPGEVVALTGAHQLQMALKNQAGGGVDPHAGHSH